MMDDLKNYQLTVKQVCKLCGFSENTFYRRVKAGRIAICKDETEITFSGKARTYVTAYALAQALEITDEATARRRIGLPAMAPQAKPTRLSLAAPVGNMPSISDPDAFSPRECDQEYRDSFVNTLTGNLSHRMFAPQPEGPPVDLQSHMDPALQGTSGQSDRHSFDAGVPADQLAAMKADWRRRSGGLSMSEQREAQERSKATINEAFQYARRPR
jgi:hypothetical protein